MSADRGRNYFVKFRYDEWLTLTCLLKPIQRDILFTIFCRRATCCKNGIQLNDYELEGIRKHYYRTMRKDAFYRYLKPMIDQGLFMKQEDIGKGTFSYTTQLNANLELELARKEELEARKEQKKALEEYNTKQNGKSANAPLFKDKKLDELYGLHKDKDHK